MPVQISVIPIYAVDDQGDQTSEYQQEDNEFGAVAGNTAQHAVDASRFAALAFGIVSSTGLPCSDG